MLLKVMPLDKTPSVDGFLVEFFTQHWSILKANVVGAIILEFFHTGKLSVALQSLWFLKSLLPPKLKILDVSPVTP